MATLKQQHALQNIMENRGNIGKSMIQAGYSENSAKNPKNLTQSKGFKELTQYYLPDDMLLRALSEDIQNKPGNRKAELALAFKIRGWDKIQPEDVSSELTPILVEIIDSKPIES